MEDSLASVWMSIRQWQMFTNVCSPSRLVRISTYSTTCVRVLLNLVEGFKDAGACGEWSGDQRLTNLSDVLIGTLFLH